MKNHLVLLTNYYPFHKGEEYLETEIKYLADAYDSVTIVPTMVNQSMKKTREVPDNTRVIGLIAPQGIRDKIGNFVRYMPRVFTSKSVMRHIRKESKLNPYKWLYNLYFEARARSVYKRLIERVGLPESNKDNKVTLYSYWFYITANVAIKLKKEYYKDNNMKLISRGHGYDINDYIKPFNFLPERTYLLRNMDALFTVSNRSCDYLREKYPKYSGKINTAPLGVETNHFQQSNRNPLKIVSCSTVRHLKRIDIIIDALQKLENQGIEYHYTHIGDGPEREDIEKRAIQKLKRENFTFTGSMKNSDINRWYEENKPDVFINTSSSEGVPVSIMEALAHATPIIASDVGGTREVVYPQKNGILIKDYKNINKVARALMDIYHLPEDEYRHLREESYKVWQEERDAKKLYTDFANYLKE